jgi:hypothetical protein
MKLFPLEDIELMRKCGKVGKNLYPFHNVWFFLKDNILQEFGFFTGYDGQTWEDEDYEYEGEAYALHYQILKRYILFDGENSHVFHIPTNEYSYWINGTNITKESDNFQIYWKNKLNVIEGKKEKLFYKEFKEDAWDSLKKLVRKYNRLLVRDKQLPLFQ